MRDITAVDPNLTPQTQLDSHSKIITFPIFLLLLYFVCTFFPKIYTYLPFLGKIKIVLLAGIALLITYLFTRDRYSNTKAYRHSLFFAWVGFLSILILGLLVSIDRGLTLNLIIINSKYFLVFAIMIRIIDNKRRLDLLLSVFAACGVGMAVITVLNYFIFGTVSAYRGIALEVGIFGDPNDLALLFNSTLPFLLFFMLKAKKRLIPLAGLVSVTVAILLTYSRGGFLGLCAVGFGFYLFFARKNKKYLLLLLVCSFLFWSFAPDQYRDRISTITDWEVDEETGMTGTRMDAWRSVMEAAIKHPFLGVGAGCSIYVAGREISDWHYVHNAFIQIFAEAGLAGLFFYSLLLVIPFRQYRGLIKGNVCLSKESILRIKAILIAFIGFMTTTFFLPQAYSPILYTLTGIYLVQWELIRKGI